MNLRRLNNQGVQQFSDYLSRLRVDPKTPIPPELIDDPRFSEFFDPIVAIERRQFATKFEAGQYLRQMLVTIPTSRLRCDVLLWCWLAVWFFDQLCPRNQSGARKPLENGKYIARAGDHRYGLDKHFLFFPWKMSLLHGERARFFLNDPVGADSRAQREWTGYHLNVSTALVELCGRLYADQTTGSLKHGATGKRPGNYREFFRALKQLEVTYDIHGMNPDQLLKILPRPQFDRWRPS
jgi:hypothetical protein